MSMHEVSGTVLLKDWDGKPGPAAVHVRLLNTTRVDAPSAIAGEVTLHDVRLDRAAEEGIDFRVSVAEMDPQARYEVAVWIDVDGDGARGRGDYVSTASHPVLTRGFPDRVLVPVRRIA
jgi:uncharacterized lipoprotein YbaY